MFVKNTWYVAALSAELSKTPIRRTLLGEPLALYRTSDGTPAMVQDRCPHRGASIGGGRVHGDHIACAYHGFTFDRDGRCVHIPGMDTIPAQAHIRAYPVREQWGWIFYWPGDPERAASTPLPEALRWLHEDGWTGCMDLLPIRANYTLVRDNLLDLTHAKFVHEKSLATQAVTERPVSTRVEAGRVRVVRNMPGIAPSPFFAQVGGHTGTVDHLQEIDFVPPCYVIIRAHVASAAGEPREHVTTLQVMNALTPETASSTHYFWGVARNFAIDRPEVTQLQSDQLHMTFDEDKVVLEDQQRLHETKPEGWRAIALPADAGCVQAERMLDRLIAAEGRA